MFADSTGYQLAVLAAKIYYRDDFMRQSNSSLTRNSVSISQIETTTIKFNGFFVIDKRIYTKLRQIIKGI